MGLQNLPERININELSNFNNADLKNYEVRATKNGDVYLKKVTWGTKLLKPFIKFQEWVSHKGRHLQIVEKIMSLYEQEKSPSLSALQNTSILVTGLLKEETTQEIQVISGIMKKLQNWRSTFDLNNPGTREFIDTLDLSIQHIENPQIPVLKTLIEELAPLSNKRIESEKLRDNVQNEVFLALYDERRNKLGNTLLERFRKLSIETFEMKIEINDQKQDKEKVFTSLEKTFGRTDPKTYCIQENTIEEGDGFEKNPNTSESHSKNTRALIEVMNERALGILESEYSKEKIKDAVEEVALCACIDRPPMELFSFVASHLSLMTPSLKIEEIIAPQSRSFKVCQQEEKNFFQYQTKYSLQLLNESGELIRAVSLHLTLEKTIGSNEPVKATFCLSPEEKE